MREIMRDSFVVNACRLEIISFFMTILFLFNVAVFSIAYDIIFMIIIANQLQID